MSEIAEIIDSVESRIQKLFTKINSLEENTASLRTELQKAANLIQQQNEQIKTLQSECESLKITNSLLGGEENKRETKLKINSLIREIDYCIAQLAD
jgi:chromosome segregation ATPase